VNVIEDAEVNCGSISDGEEHKAIDMPSMTESPEEFKGRLQEEIRLLNCCTKFTNCLLLKSTLEDAVNIVYK
jgi:hypothetical protein